MPIPRGHGTYVDEDKLTASVAGEVERVDKLICVKPLKTRYVGLSFFFEQLLLQYLCSDCVVDVLLSCRFNGEVGDVVVGRITEVRSSLVCDNSLKS